MIVNLVSSAYTLDVGGGEDLNINVRENEDSTLTLTLLKDGSPFDITDYDVRAKASGSDKTIIFYLEDDFTISTSTLTWVFYKEKLVGNTGSYPYDLIVEDPVSGDITVLTKAIFTILDGQSNFDPPPPEDLIIF